MNFFTKIFQKGLVFVLLCLLVPSLVLAAGGGDSVKRRVIKGAETFSIKGYARHWNDVKKVPLSEGATKLKVRPVLNFEATPKVVRSSDADAAVQRDYPRRAVGMVRTMLQMALPYLDFDGLYLGGGGTGIPPDTTGDVGLTYYIQAVNSAFGIFRKSDGVLISSTSFDNFFGGPGITGTPCDNDNMGDPIVLFDRDAQRWFILDFAWDPSETDGSYYSIAVSQTSDPTGSWWMYAMRADLTLMNDYPKCGIWHDGIYITANMFPFGGNFQGVRIWALNKSDLYSGTLTSQTVYDGSTLARSILPSNATSPTMPAAGTPNYMFSMDASEYGGTHQDRLVIWEYDVDWNNSINTSWTGPTTLATAAFGLTMNNVPQGGSTQTVHSLYGRLMYPANYREFDGHAAVYLNHVVEHNSRRTKRWYEVRFDNTGTPSIYQQGTYAPDTNHRWMGSVAADEDGNIALGYSVSSTSMDPAIRYTGRSSINPALDVMNLGENVIINGTGSQTTYNRWGDYTTMSIDPVDDKTFWYTNEYYTTNGYYWKTRIAAFRIKPDLWSKDNIEDTGVEPNTTTTQFWRSPDIWVRNQQDGLTNQVHENPEYGQTNYMYVRIRCRDSEGHGLVKTYWAFPGTGLGWEGSWNPIGEQMTTYIASGNEEILEFPWDPPDPGVYGSGHFCLLSRIETAPQPPWGMTFPEGPYIGVNTRNNNNIVWKNVTIVDSQPNGSISIISVGNLTREEVEARLEFAAPMVQTPEGLRTILEWGTVRVNLGKTLFHTWKAAGGNGTGIAVDDTTADTIIIRDPNAVLEDILLGAGEEHLIAVEFKPFPDSIDDTATYILDAIQFDFDGTKFNETGGVRFEIKLPK